ncbi:MAG TPA: HAMP domain-containing sensor histidine kinase [Bacteroidales bacterium]|nr:HAMP domain-containing sensor histidine kinase [Bacteroidales bacterium]HSA42923.1 HAMP domain-containing sensor histidine kinase [Bacteroidales bacterium]
MKKKWIPWIVLMTSLSLIGIIITQLFWVMKSVELKDEQFGHRVELGLRSVVQRLLVHTDHENSELPGCGMVCGLADTTLLGNFSPRLLDSLVREEFEPHVRNKDYVYGIFTRKDKQLIFASASSFHKELTNTKLFVSLSCLYQPECYVLGIYFPEERSLAVQSMISWLVLSVVFVIFLLSGFAYSVYALIRQKKLSDMKTDFVNNMTHEFKTPISTIFLASEMLTREGVIGSPERIERYGSIIHNEINRLKNQVEQVLQVAVLDKGEFTIRKRKMDVHRVLEGILKSFSVVVKKRDGYVISRLHAGRSVIVADRDHFINVMHNLLDNAEKYSPGAPVITISTENVNGGIRISVEDRGIGISPDAQKHIFKKLYRVPTGNIHNVKGFGLGLYYVRTMVEAHNGSVSMLSEPGRGSRFDVFFPFTGKEDQILTDEEQTGENITD